MKTNHLLKLLLPAIFVSIIFVACEQQAIVNTPASTLENIQVSDENNTEYEMTPEEEQLLYESLTSNEGNSEEDTDITLRVDPYDYPFGASWIKNVVVFRSKSGDCGNAQWCYYACPGNRYIGDEFFKFSRAEYIISDNSTDASNHQVNKTVSAGKPANHFYDSECYRSTAYPNETNAFNNFVYRVQYRRSGQDYREAHWTSWKYRGKACVGNNDELDCY